MSGHWHKLPNIDEILRKIQEEAPVNSVGGGNIAGVGVGPKGEPGANSSTVLRRNPGGIKEENSSYVIYNNHGQKIGLYSRESASHAEQLAAKHAKKEWQELHNEGWKIRKE